MSVIHVHVVLFNCSGAMCLCFKASLNAKPFYKNEFELHEKETAYRTHFHMTSFALRVVLKQRHKRTPKWPIAPLQLNNTTCT